MIVIPPHLSQNLIDFDFKHFFFSPYVSENLKVETGYRVKRLKGMIVPRLEDISKLGPTNITIKQTSQLSSEKEKKEIYPENFIETKSIGLIHPTGSDEEDANRQEPSDVPLNDNNSLPASPSQPPLTIPTPAPPSSVTIK